MSRRRIVGRTLKRGSLRAAAGLGLLEIAAERDYNLLSDVYGNQGIYDSRDRLNKELDRLVGSKSKPSTLLKKTETTPEGMLELFTDPTVMGIIAVTYGGTLTLNVILELSKVARKELNRRKALKNNVTDIKKYITGVKITGKDIVKANEIIKITPKMTGQTFKKFSAGERIAYLKKLGKAPNQSVRAVLTVRERDFLRNLTSGKTLSDINRMTREGMVRQQIIDNQNKIIKKKNKTIREMTYKSTRPVGPKLLPAQSSGKKYPLALRPQPTTQLFDEILGGTAKDRMKSKQYNDMYKWWNSLSKTEQVKIIGKKTGQGLKTLGKKTKQGIVRRVKKF